MNTIEVIGATGKTIFTSLIEIILEIFVNLGGSLSSFNHNEAYREFINSTFILKRLPIDFALMMTNINAMNLIAFGVTDVAIERPKTETKGTDEEIIEEIDVSSKDCCSS